MRCFAGSRTAPWARLRGRTTTAPVPALARRHPHRGFSDLFRNPYFGEDTYKAEPREEEEGPLQLAFATACLPHPKKAHRGGEDSYYACHTSRSFGIADGVGGWERNGVDPGEFARCLLRFAHRNVHEVRHTSADLQSSLLEAFHELRRSGLQGGTTALLGQINDQTLSILNLGDSGAMVLRPAWRTPPNTDQPLIFPRVVFRSTDQTHYFNCPYQLGSGANAPVEVPDSIRIRVRAGDLLVAATDGVFDNLFDHQVQELVARQLGWAWRAGAEVAPHLEDLARMITEQAHAIGTQEDQRDIVTPFAVAAQIEGLPYRGGKLDDTAVVVGLVCRESPDESKVPTTGESNTVEPDHHNFR